MRSAPYAAGDAAEGVEEITENVDVYAFAMYEVLTTNWRLTAAILHRTQPRAWKRN